MRAIYSRTGSAEPENQSTVPAGAPAAVPRQVTHRIDWNAARTAERACCCPAKPRVVAIIPPASGREHRTELLLCMHHFRASMGALFATGAAALDLSGRLIAREASPYLAAG